MGESKIFKEGVTVQDLVSCFVTRTLKDDTNIPLSSDEIIVDNFVAVILRLTAMAQAEFEEAVTND